MFSGCKRDDPPPELTATKKKPAKAAKKKPAKAVKKPDVGPDDEASWPAAVREDAYRLFTARLHYANPAAIKLAHHGLEAVPAMSKVVESKFQPAKKKAFISMLMVEMHIFRPDDLIRLAARDGMPFVQRAAIESLARLRLERTERALDALTAALKKLAINLKKNPKLVQDLKGPPSARSKMGKHAGHGHGKPGAGAEVDPTIPLLRFLDQARHKSRAWPYDDKQLATLDRLYQARTQQEMLAALDWFKDPVMEQGLLAIIRSPAARPMVVGGAIQRVLAISGFKADRLREFCEAGYPRYLRMAAARFLLKRQGAEAHGFLARMARKQGDPLAPYFEQLLQSEVKGP